MSRVRERRGTHAARIRRNLLLTLLFICMLSMPAFASQARIAIVDTTSSGSPAFIASALRRAGASVSIVKTKKGCKTSKYDALVIPGGDVNPKRYGKKNRASYGISNRKDRLQIYAVKKFMKAKKPILGICRGEQIINVALGGTLRQNISGHMDRWKKVRFKKGTWLYGLYGSSLRTSHWHHQCVRTLGEDLIVSCYYKSGKKTIIEGIQHKTLPIYGIQWHPEFDSKNGSAVFKSFVRLAKKYRKK